MFNHPVDREMRFRDLKLVLKLDLKLDLMAPLKHLIRFPNKMKRFEILNIEICFRIFVCHQILNTTLAFEKFTTRKLFYGDHLAMKFIA